MSIYARIQDGKVVEFFSTSGDITEMFHPDLIWVDITMTSPEPKLGWSAKEAAGKWVFSAASTK